MADIAIINPRFDISFWGMEHCIGLLGKRANLRAHASPCLQRIGDGFRFAPQQPEYWRRHRLAQARRGAADYLKFLAVASRLLISVKDPALRSRYRQQLWRILRAREPHILLI